MKARASLGLATAVALAMVLLVLPTTGIGQGRSRDVPVDVTFRNAATDMIGGGPVAARIGNNGSLFLSDDDATGHRMHVWFNAPTVDAPSPYNCREWGPVPFTWQMELASDLSTPREIYIGTGYQYGYTTTFGWAPMMNPPPKKGTATAHFLDLVNDVPPGEKRYVQMAIRIWVNSSNDAYDIWMNREWPTTSGYPNGVFEVEAGRANAGRAGDVFTIRPLVAGQPHPLQGLSNNEALLYMVDFSDGSQDPSGPCNMGNFMMPFEMYVRRK
jgi:hypothetical protein